MALISRFEASPLSIFALPPINSDHAAKKKNYGKSKGSFRIKTRYALGNGCEVGVPPAASFTGGRKQDVLDRVQVMQQQENSGCYKRERYLFALETLSKSRTVSTDDVSSSSTPTLSTTTRTSSGAVEARHFVTWRKQMTEWAYDAVDVFGFQRDVVEIAFSFLDRYLACCIQAAAYTAGDVITDNGLKRYRVDGRRNGPSMFDGSKEMFQLASMTSLYIACKIHDSFDDAQTADRDDANTDCSEGSRATNQCVDPDDSGKRVPKTRRLVMSIDSLVMMSRGNFRRRHFREMELDILTHLDYRMNPPTALSFVSAILDYCFSAFYTKDNVQMGRKLGHEQHLLRIRARYDCILVKCRQLTELAVGDYSFTGDNPSTVAIASVLIAMNDDSHSNDTRNSLFSFIGDAIANTLDNYNIVRGLTALNLHPDTCGVMKCGKRMQKLLKNKKR